MSDVILQFCLVFFTCQYFAQQEPDTSFIVPTFTPKFANGNGPRVVIDEDHNNFHTISGGYSPFAKVLRADGYHVSGIKNDLEKEGIFVIVNALNPVNIQDPGKETLSAFSDNEIKGIQAWVKAGGRLFLIADHMPFAGAAKKLGEAFGFRFHNGFVFDTTHTLKFDFFSKAEGLLARNEITTDLDSIITFTGSAFDKPANAFPILSFNKKHQIFLCREAWIFEENTTKVCADGTFQGAYMKYGKGRIVVFGEAAMFTAQISNKHKVGLNRKESKNNLALLLNIMHWLSA